MSIGDSVTKFGNFAEKTSTDNSRKDERAKEKMCCGSFQADFEIRNNTNGVRLILWNTFCFSEPTTLKANEKLKETWDTRQRMVFNVYRCKMELKAANCTWKVCNETKRVIKTLGWRQTIRIQGGASFWLCGSFPVSGWKVCMPLWFLFFALPGRVFFTYVGVRDVTCFAPAVVRRPARESHFSVVFDTAGVCSMVSGGGLCSPFYTGGGVIFSAASCFWVFGDNLSISFLDCSRHHISN